MRLPLSFLLLFIEPVDEAAPTPNRPATSDDAADEECAVRTIIVEPWPEPGGPVSPNIPVGGTAAAAATR